ncbi:MAG: DUF4349 domain-containing protein [Chthoniobacterales bacterium]|nr:DUF4349 domain-containing protein [Chthoniobacterales bacterium]
MPAIHDEIEPWLAAAVHDQLSPEEHVTFRAHLATCESCRALHEEELTMSKMIESTLEEAKPDLAFEQRIVSGFRKRLPYRGGLASLLVGLFRLRATQITAAAAVMLTLVQVGKVVTRENAGEREKMQGASELGIRDERDRLLRGPQDSASLANSSKATEGKASSPQSESLADSARTVAEPRTAAAPLKSEAEPLVAREQTEPAESLPAPAPEFAEERPEDGADRMTTMESSVAASIEDAPPPPAADANRKLIRNAQVELEIAKFDEAVQKITSFATGQRGYVATSSSAKQENGKLRGEVVVKVLPDTLDTFLLQLRGLGEVKNQTLGTQDVTKQYFDTDSRLNNARVMEQRLIDILKTKTGKVSDLLEVEKELGRVRQQIEQMQGELKFMDAQVQFATVTISLAEKDMNLPAAFLLKRTAHLALYSTDVEKTFAEVKTVIEGAKAQLSSSTLDRDSTGEATARLVLLIAPEEADTLIVRIKGMGRVQNYTDQTDRVAQGGTGMAENAKVERDKVELSITISRNEEEPALQTTSLRILASAVSDKVARLKENAAGAGAEIRSSSFSRDPDGQEIANLTLRVPLKNYAPLLSSFDQLGKVKDVSVQRADRRGTINEETAPADISIQVYSQPNIVSDETGLFATIRHTLGQGFSALMWSLRMIGVAIAFLAPWVVAIGLIAWVVASISRARAARRAKREVAE